MARKLAMTWVPDQRRWIKKHRGKMYSVSCRQLERAETKEASAQAANGWWEAKLKEIEAAPPSEEDRRANALRVWTMVNDWKQLSEDDRERLVDSLVGEGQYRQIKAHAEAMVESAVKETPRDRTVAAQADAWKASLRSACEGRQLSEGRYDAYCRRIRYFTEWVGPGAPIDAIDEARLEAYFNHLSAQVREGRYSPSSAHELLMTAKQFIARLASFKLIPLPGNIRDRRFRFNHSVAQEIETFTVEELRELLAASDEHNEKTKLFILLMLNTGAYQNDIAELRQDEVDWSRGTIKRARSKTRERRGPVVTYKLWPEAFALLKKYRSDGELVLTTAKGKPLVAEMLDDDGRYSKYDTIRSAWLRLAVHMGLKKSRLGMKHLRKTSASLLGEHPQYKYYTTYFLADSPKHMSDKHYVRPSEAEFFKSLEWLRAKILGRQPSRSS